MCIATRSVVLPLPRKSSRSLRAVSAILGFFAEAQTQYPMCGRHPVGKDFYIVMKSWSVAPMCPACLLGANTDGLHAIREISSRSKARA
jgi:hypothetical protein